MDWRVTTNNTIIMLTTEIINKHMKLIQNILNIEETGIWNEETKAALKNFQLTMNKTPSGLADPDTITLLFSRANIDIKNLDAYDPDTPCNELDATTDLSEPKLVIHENLLPPSQYNNDPVNQFEYIFIHHTSGNANPDAVMVDWRDDDRGRIGVHYIIGGTSIKNDDMFDGKVVKCIPDKYWAFHLGSVSKDKINAYMHKNSIGIELCNFGYLTKSGNSFKTYTGATVHSSQVLDLGYKFLGYQYWHKYSVKQLESLRLLLLKLGSEFNINIKNGLPNWLHALNKLEYHKAFEFNEQARDGKIKGILSHTNVRKDKTDVYPHPQLIELLLGL